MWKCLNRTSQNIEYGWLSVPYHNVSISCHLRTARSEVFVEMMDIPHLVKKFPALYETKSFTTMVTKAHHLLPSWARLIQFTPSHPISLKFTLTLFSHLCLGIPSGPFASDFPTKLCRYFSSPLKLKLVKLTEKWKINLCFTYKKSNLINYGNTKNSLL